MTNTKDKCKCGNDCKCHEEGKNKKDKHLKEIKKLKEENASLVEQVKYIQAELINYRKRKDDEIANYKKYCNQDLIIELIGVIDNFERAIKLDDAVLDDDLSKFLDGFKMMYATLREILKKYGVTEINNVGEPFNPQEEEALMTDNIKDMDDDIVTEVLLKGYKLHDRVIRPASVKVNKKLEGEDNNE